MALSRTWYDTLLDDSGAGADGTILDKADIDALMDAVDAEIARLDAAILGAAVPVVFPATQIDAADPNTLDDYEEGNFTPVITFATPGDLAVTYGGQTGRYTKIGRTVSLHILLTTTAFTHTTASGALQITGIPFTANSAIEHLGSLSFAGITKANYTQYCARLNGSTTIVDVIASGSGQSRSAVTAVDMPTGGTVQLQILLVYYT